MRVIGGRGGVSQNSAKSASSANSEIDYSQWLTKAVAARRLDVSTKTIEQLDKSGTLPGTLYRRPTGGPRIRVYDPARVAKLVAERRLGRPVTVLAPGSNGDASTGGESMALMVPEVDQRAASALGAFLEAVALVAKSAKSVSESSQILVLTLEDAAAVSGWSVGFLRRARAAGTLPAERDRWRGPDGRWHVGWKIRRKDLEAL